MALALVAGLATLLVAGRPASGAGELPVGFSLSRVVSGLEAPAAMQFAPDGRLFVSEKGGALRIVKDGRLLSRPFVDLSNKVDSAGARGLLGIAFDPDFENNKFVYVYYTRKATEDTPAHNRVARLTADGNRAVPGSEKVIFGLDKLSDAKNHNGGAINFGKDGKLYVAVGDNDRATNAQSLETLKGKLLRINKDGSIPEGNPFLNETSGKYRAIWALGLRNPFVFAVQPGTGRIFINDVGEKTWEEIDKGIEGANYGWPVHEGPEDDPRYQGPVFAYRHDGPPETSGCSITGGAFYNPQETRFPDKYVGDYFFTDFCNGWIRRYELEGGPAKPFQAPSGKFPVDLKVRNNGDLYILAYTGNPADRNGVIERIRYTG